VLWRALKAGSREQQLWYLSYDSMFSPHNGEGQIIYNKGLELIFLSDLHYSFTISICIRTMSPGLDLSAIEVANEGPIDTTVIAKTPKGFPGVTSTGTIVIDPAYITTDFDLLRFGAAAFEQLRVSRPDHVQETSSTDSKEGQHFSTLLVSSPYNNPGHFLDLQTLDTANLIFSKALTALKPARTDYATAPYTDALSFSAILELVRNLAKHEAFEWKEQSFYVVVFRSKLKAEIDNERLYKLDYESHREACESGGLLKYWFGKPDSERRNLATCMCELSFFSTLYHR
jgi:hypothetical protein